MQHDDTTCESDVEEEYEIIQVTKHMFVKQKKSDKQKIKEIVKIHPYKKWEDIIDNASTTD